MDTDMKKCPYCAEEILKSAIKCKYCKEDLNTSKTKNVQTPQNQLIKVCPSCAEEIKDEAWKCRYCGEIVATGLSVFMYKNASLLAVILLAVLFWFFSDEYLDLIWLYFDTL